MEGVPISIQFNCMLKESFTIAIVTKQINRIAWRCRARIQNINIYVWENEPLLHAKAIAKKPVMRCECIVYLKI